MNINWNAEGYSSNFFFVHQYGEKVLELLEIEPGSSVIDLGCGNGALTQQIASMGANVIGIDASEEMLSVARAHYPNLPFVQADALEFSVAHPVEAIFSNAVFHWIDRDKQQTLLQNINRALKLHGQLVCEFGGKGCGAQVHNALRRSFECRGKQYMMPFYFPSIGEYTPMVERAGLKVVFATLFDRLTRCVNGMNGLRDWINMFVKVPFYGIDEKTKEEILDETEHALSGTLLHDGEWYIDYVRIRLKAVKEQDVEN